MKKARTKPPAKKAKKGLAAPASHQPVTPVPSVPVRSPSAAPETPAASVPESGASTPQVKSETSTNGKALPALIEKAQSALQQLQQVTPGTLWTQTVKGKDLDARIQKGIDLASKLESRTSEANAQELATQINSHVNRLSQESEVVQLLQANPEPILFDKKEALIKMANGFSPDECLVFLTDAAKRLVEARVGD